ncbi:MAG: hypothetical protein II781_00570 [Clostridia bacterium]|nr:hypothetical protein [Clostridia bacterium]
MRDVITLTLDPLEQRLVIKGLADFRNLLIENERPFGEVDDLLVKILEASEKRRTRDREER